MCLIHYNLFLTWRLHNEIEEFYTVMSATQEERDARIDVIKRITNLVHD